MELFNQRFTFPERNENGYCVFRDNLKSGVSHTEALVQEQIFIFLEGATCLSTFVIAGKKVGQSQAMFDRVILTAYSIILFSGKISRDLNGSIKFVCVCFRENCRE